MMKFDLNIALTLLQQGDYKTLARCISFVENEAPGYEIFMRKLPINTKACIIGVTGPPGAGKSTLTDALIEWLVAENKKIGVLCIDPSSPFNLGALLGDRIRMSDWYNHPNVYIRSLASRGSLGGLHPHIIEVTSTMQAAGFDYVIIETVGVGQSEIEIVGLADITVVVMVPEAGDEIQTMKAGLMEIADVFVVNKSDRPDADLFVRNLRLMLAPAFNKTHNVSIVKTVASEKKGIDDLIKQIKILQSTHNISDKRYWLLTEKAYQIIQKSRMRDVDKVALSKEIVQALENADFNLYEFLHRKYPGS
ncbi:methylmalonyl Co-A mutase-associated GTPase MeaB [Chitinophagaceae bacterium LWZ2-11]